MPYNPELHISDEDRRLAYELVKAIEFLEENGYIVQRSDKYKRESVFSRYATTNAKDIKSKAVEEAYTQAYTDTGGDIHKSANMLGVSVTMVRTVWTELGFITKGKHL